MIYCSRSRFLAVWKTVKRKLCKELNVSISVIITDVSKVIQQTSPDIVTSGGSDNPKENRSSVKNIKKYCISLAITCSMSVITVKDMCSEQKKALIWDGCSCKLHPLNWSTVWNCKREKLQTVHLCSDLSWPDRSYWIINCPCQMSAQCVRTNQTNKSEQYLSLGARPLCG